MAALQDAAFVPYIFISFHGALAFGLYAVHFI